MPRSQADGGLGVTLKPAAADFAGSLSVPEWPEAGGLSASDLRWRTHLDTAPWLVSAGADLGADGLLGRRVIGKGVAVFCQVDPDRFQADEKTYFRYTRWRSTRAVAQLLANLGASFAGDRWYFSPSTPRLEIWTAEACPRPRSPVASRSVPDTTIPIIAPIFRWETTPIAITGGRAAGPPAKCELSLGQPWSAPVGR